jgi:hypothetical protein
MATGQRVDPFGNFNFLVEIDGITRAAFHEASEVFKHHAQVGHGSRS